MRQEASQLEVAQLRNKVATKIVQSLHAIEEKDQLVSHFLARGSHLARLWMAIAQVTAQMVELYSLHSVVSQEVIALTVQLQSQYTSYADNIKTLFEGLKVAS